MVFDINNINDINDIDNIHDMSFDKNIVNMFIMMIFILF